MQILYVAAEIYPLVKTGGLGDVTAALPPALISQGVDVRVMLPGIPAIMQGIIDLKPIAVIDNKFGTKEIRLLLGKMPDTDVPAYVIDAPELFARPGNPYIGPDGKDWHDNHLRFALLSWMAAHMALSGFDKEWIPQVIHGHDWHTGLMPAYVAASAAENKPATILTIHNLAYQGLFPYSLFDSLALPHSFFSVDGLEFYGQVSFMKAGLIFADSVTTVSPTYAKEILSKEFGCGLEGVLSSRANTVTGILNGVDYSIWDAATDTALPKKYSTRSLKGKAACKKALQAEFGLEESSDRLLLGVVSRLAYQKGLDLVLGALPEIISAGAQIIMLGSGDHEMEKQFLDIAKSYSRSVAVHIGYSESFSHRIIAGSDVILVPSRFEPCGLTQLYGLRYGTLPLVRRVGGLADSVVDVTNESKEKVKATGFVFQEASQQALLQTIHRANELYKDKDAWTKVMKNAMKQNFSWEKSAQDYMKLYQGLLS